MAQKAAKTLATRNTQTLNRTLIITAAVHALFLLLRGLLFRRSFTTRSLTLYLVLSAPSLIIQSWFERIGRPTYGAAPGELRRSGEDLEAKGLTEWMWDVLYWTYICLGFAAILGDWAWWSWAAVPAYSAWLAYTTFVGARQGMAGMVGAGGEGGDSAQSKRQQKMEKRGGQKMQYR